MGLINNNIQLPISTTTLDSYRRFHNDSESLKYPIGGDWRSAELV